MECQADMPCNAAAMFFNFNYMFMRGSLCHCYVNAAMYDAEGAHKGQ